MHQRLDANRPRRPARVLVARRVDPRGLPRAYRSAILPIPSPECARVAEAADPSCVGRNQGRERQDVSALLAPTRDALPAEQEPEASIPAGTGGRVRHHRPRDSHSEEARRDEVGIHGGLPAERRALNPGGHLKAMTSTRRSLGSSARPTTRRHDSQSRPPRRAAFQVCIVRECNRLCMGCHRSWCSSK